MTTMSKGAMVLNGQLTGGAAAARSHARITDVAALAGVSIKTVSRVVNDEPGAFPPHDPTPGASA